MPERAPRDSDHRHTVVVHACERTPFDGIARRLRGHLAQRDLIPIVAELEEAADHLTGLFHLDVPCTYPAAADDDREAVANLARLSALHADRSGDAPSPATAAVRIGSEILDPLDSRIAMLAYACHLSHERRWFRLTATRIPGPGAARIVVHHDPITAQRLARERLELRARQLDAVDVATIGMGLDGVVLTWNAAAERLHGWTAEEAIGRRVDEVTVPAEHRDAAWAAFCTILDADGWEGELVGAHRDGSVFPVLVNNHVVTDVDGDPIGIVGIGVDVSARVAREREIAQSNTWLRAITDRMGEGLCTLDAQGRVVYVNPKGEQLLGATNGSVVGGSFVNRLLGMRPDGSPKALGEQLIGADFDGGVPGEVTEERLLQADGTVLPIEYVATPLPDTAPHGPGGWVITFRDISERLERQQQHQVDAEHAQWMTRIQNALDEDHFVLHAQPIVDIATGDTVQHELLIRMQDPDEGLILPGAFLPTAELFGLIPAIDRWVIGRSIALAAVGHPVEINLSARSFADPALPYLIEQMLRDSGADPATLVFELTETALLENNESATRFAHHIRALGCQLALDDFGTGYGAFTYLKNLPVDVIKIDIEFVRDAVTSAASRHVITAVVSLARAFDLVTVAEGVEDQATLELLAELGVDQAQGYHLARPAPLDQTALAGNPQPA